MLEFKYPFERNIMEVLEDSPFAFHLTGSHRFGNSLTATDIDLFAEDSREIRYFLEENGFVGSAYSREKDKNCAAIMQFLGETHIEVFLSEDISARIAAHELAESVTWKYIPKELRTFVWNDIYKSL